MLNFVALKDKQLVPLSLSHTSGLARICMVADGLAGHCSANVGFSISVGALLSNLVLRLLIHYIV